MTTADTPTGKLHPIAKWSLIIGPILVVVFNFLMPTAGMDPGEVVPYLTDLGLDADIAQIYMVLILLGSILFTRAIIGLYQIAPANSVARQRLGIGMLGAVAALGFWGVALGLGLAEASAAETMVAGNAKSAAAGAVGAAMHAGFFGVFQVAIYVSYIALIPIGGGIAVSGLVRKEFGWVITLLGVVAVILTSIMPVNTEEGSMVFGILATIWGVVFLAMGLMIMKQDMD
jgi:hypothetical protein